MKSRIVKATEIIGLVLIAVTIAQFFLLTNTKELIDWICIGLILLAEVIMITAVLYIESKLVFRNAIMFRTGMYIVIGVFTGASILTSILFQVLFRDGLRYLFAIQLILVAIFAIIMVVVYHSSLYIGNVNSSTKQSIHQMNALLSKVELIQSIHGNGKLKSELSQLSEAVRFCDVSTTVATDDTIGARLVELHSMIEGNGEAQLEATKKLIQDIMLLVKQRSQEVKLLKVGGI